MTSTRSLLALALSAVLAAGCGPRVATAPPPAGTRLVFTSANVVDVENGRVLRGHVVVVRDGRIEQVGSRAPAPLPGDSVVDARGAYVVPGLWDMHTHVDETHGSFFPLAVANGVLGLRDMGSSMEQVRSWSEHLERGPAPRVVAAGPIVFGVASDPDPRLVAVRTAAEGERAVDSLAAAGAGFIKVYDYLPRDAYLAIARRAAARGLVIAGHQPLEATADDLIAAGQRSVEHVGNAFGGLLLDAAADPVRARAPLAGVMASSENPGALVERLGQGARASEIVRGFDRARARDMLRRMAAADMYLTPSLRSFSRMVLLPADTAAGYDPNLAYLSPPVRALVPDLRAMLRQPGPGAREQAARDSLFALHQEFVRMAHAAGVRVLAGSDVAPWPSLVPGFALHDELEELVAAGLSPADALRAATVNPARYFGREGEWGTVAAGRSADLVFLSANPLSDIRATRGVVAVVVQGRYLDRAALDGLLRGIRAD